MLRSLVWPPVILRFVRGLVSHGRHDAARGGRRLLVDLSLISRKDTGTGVQRVVRNLYAQISASPPAGWKVQAIAAKRRGHYVAVVVEMQDDPDLGTKELRVLHTEPLHISASDVFIGLDLAPRVVSDNKWLLLRWRRRGVRIHFLVYDMLPLLHPEWFNNVSVIMFKRWLTTLALVSDGLICISRTAQIDVRHWLLDEVGLRDGSVSVKSIHLGGDLDGLSMDRARCSALLGPSLSSRTYVLMVGTLEPRKAYGSVLDAFEELWRKGINVTLVIAGRRGWKEDDLIHRITGAASLADSMLRWYDGPTDEVLASLYTCCAGLLMASRGEGLGLPIVEAMRYKKPVLARDLPIFREIGAGRDISFFSDDSDLADCIEEWLERVVSRTEFPTPQEPLAEWSKSAEQLLDVTIGCIPCD